jgi:glyoxalase family protein
MPTDIRGIHHITAIAGDVQRNVDFYVGLLGLRLVKLTVNFDDPGTYHLYYGDEEGHPGTILTFFPWGAGRPGRIGTGQATVTSFSIPEGSLTYWVERLKRANVPFSGPVERFDEQVLYLADPDGIRLELVAHRGAERRPGWVEGPVPHEHAIRGFYGVTLSLADSTASERLLTEVMRFCSVQEAGNRWRFEVGEGGPGAYVDVLTATGEPRGLVSIGTVHHVAWRVADQEALLAWQAQLAGAGLQVTPVMDRKYFQSVYFREPGGVLFELATDPPGFALDESLAELGTHLMLPEWLEPMRDRLEAVLPAIRIPVVNADETSNANIGAGANARAGEQSGAAANAGPAERGSER